MKIACYLLAAACVAYFAVLILYSGWQTDFAWIWPALGLFLFLLGILARKPAAMVSPALRVLRGAGFFLLLAGILAAGMIGFRVLSGMRQKEGQDLEYVVVLGAQVRGNVPSRALTKRLEKARAFAASHPETRLILSGGKGSGENMTEASCMRGYLTAHGVEEERLLLEENSTSTWENLVFSDRLTGCGAKRTGILSNNFHITRSLLLAKKAGYVAPVGIPASSDLVMQPHFVLREIAALAWEFLKQLR